MLPDIIASTKAKIKSYVLPKINTSKDVKLIEKIKKYLKSNNLNFFILIESSMAIINLKEICTCQNIKGLIFGAEDFLNDLNIFEVYDNTNIDLPRSIIPIYAHAYNLNCIDTHI